VIELKEMWWGKKKKAWHWWLSPVILATQKAENRRIEV
jgi:hypothetical protein